VRAANTTANIRMPKNTRQSSCHRGRQNWLSNRVFDGYDAACDAWQKLLAVPEAITSIGMREWAHVGQSQ
jgi:hypothetical protein